MKKFFKKSIEENKNLLDKNNHISFVNMLFLNNCFDGKKELQRELMNKLSNYKQQDKRKKRYNSESFIKLEELLEKLVVTKLKCNYCKDQCLLFYKNVREQKMWTLDRIDNNIGHNKDNVVISCLACNLQKRRRGEEAFKFMKQMVITKKIFRKKYVYFF